jgi:hypothetical protein
MPKRLVILLAVLALLVAAVPARAQDGNPFNGIPPAQPTAAPTVEPADNSSSDDVGRATLYIIAGALAVSFVGIGWWISRDARRTLPADRRNTKPRDQGPHRHERQAKAKARAKGRAQRQARKIGRRAGR